MALRVEKETGGIHSQESESLPPPSTMPDGKCSEQKSGFLFWLLQFLNPLFYVRLVQYYSGITSGTEYGKRITESPHDPAPVPADATVIDCGYNDRGDASRFSELPQVELEHMDLTRASEDNCTSVKTRPDSYSEDENAASHISNDDNNMAVEPAESAAALDKPDKNTNKSGRKNGKKGKRGKAKK
ncbi:hypothetical protein LPJ55_005477 [Coemansia sp. RSA 990]|nr:hypothetical protein LPJ55_005477 [Coemansia sp. RSA 990]